MVLAATLAVDGADKGTVAATVPQLVPAFGLTNTQIGLLASVVALADAAFTIPVGLLTDRSCRTRLLPVSVALWRCLWPVRVRPTVVADVPRRAGRRHRDVVIVPRPGFLFNWIVGGNQHARTPDAAQLVHNLAHASAVCAPGALQSCNGVEQSPWPGAA
ncbi:hypothetical protein [Streptomyces similanensis]|uniref:hypothetical protein n=1 Tax=Streptomyces similanensis TaxID=1274988 RepID=UPI0031EF0B7C